MQKSLTDYLKNYTPTGAEAPQAPNLADYHKEEQETEQGLACKEKILNALENGTPAPLVLELCIDCIGLLTHSQEFTAIAKNKLKVYGDLKQISMFSDVDDIEKRLKTLQNEYIEKNLKQIARQLASIEKTERGLNDIKRSLQEYQHDI